MSLLLTLAVVLLFYIYAGYPLLLRLIVWLRGARLVRRRDVTPSISLVISAFNEAAVIRQKIENALALDYPADALEVVVVSDASDDGTDEIVSEYANRGVRLMRQPERRGKTSGLNRTVPQLAGEVVVFSDANAMYERNALRRLARNFADPAVGCVTGEARYLPGGTAAADVSERVYWGYEIQVKRLETSLGSMVGGDGAIYAIRRSLWRELPDDAINDFLNPLQIVEAGWRGVYEPDAICYEETAGGIRTEYRRRVRIVSRSWRAVFQARGVLNPFRTGLFSWCVVSHKMLRWVSGVAAVVALAGLAGLAAPVAIRWPATTLAVAVLVPAMVSATTTGRRAATMLWYFGVINAASLVGVAKGSLGRVSGVWSPPREQGAGRAARPGVIVPVGPLFLSTFTLAAAAVAIVPGSEQTAETIFWASLIALLYVYVAYPILLALLGLVAPRPVAQQRITPRVCLFIAANDEESVIEAKLRNALELDYPPDRLDIVVASDGSVDDTNRIVGRFAPRVRLLEFIERRGKIAAINDGVQALAADIVVFSDANTFLDRNAIRMLVRNFADPGVGSVSGDVMLVGERAAFAKSEDLYYLYERWMQRAESRVGSMIGADGALYAIRRDLFSRREGDTILDDMAIPMAVVRAGYRAVFEPEARAREQGSETATEEFARKSRVIAGAVQFMTRADSSVPLRLPQVIFSLVSHKALRWVSPAFGTSVFLTSIALAPRSTFYEAAAAVLGLLVVLGLLGCIPALRRRTLIAVAHYFCLVQAAAAVGLLRGVGRRQSVLWQRYARSTSVRGAAA